MSQGTEEDIRQLLRILTDIKYLFMYAMQMFFWCLMWVFILSAAFPLYADS
jgi:hypothetical protein